MRILVFSLSSPGFVFPLVGVAGALAEKGHEIAFVTGSSFEGIIRKQGFEFLRSTAHRDPDLELARWPHVRSVARNVKLLMGLEAEYRPDAILSHYLSYPPLYVGELRGVPIAMLGLAAYLYPPEVTYDGIVSEREKRNRLWQYRESIEMYNSVRKVLSLGSTELKTKNPLLGDIFLLQSVPEFQIDFRFLPCNVRCVGSCLWEPEQSDKDAFEWAEASKRQGKKIMYVQLGRTFGKPSFWPQLVTALENEPISVAVSTGRADFSVADAPGNFFVRKHVSQAAILPLADAVVANGHTSAVLGAITNGLPSVLLPNGSGTFEIAARCRAAGISLCLNSEFDSGRLGSASKEALNCRTLRRNTDRIRGLFSRAGGLKAAAAHVESLGRIGNRNLEFSAPPYK